MLCRVRSGRSPPSRLSVSRPIGSKGQTALLRLLLGVRLDAQSNGMWRKTGIPQAVLKVAERVLGLCFAYTFRKSYESIFS